MAIAQGVKDAFKTPAGLIGYVRVHRTTPRALIHNGHLALVLFVAGRDLSSVPQDVFDSDGFSSLRDFDSETLCDDADARIAAGQVPENWIEACAATLVR